MFFYVKGTDTEPCAHEHVPWGERSNMINSGHVYRMRPATINEDVVPGEIKPVEVKFDGFDRRRFRTEERRTARYRLEDDVGLQFPMMPWQRPCNCKLCPSCVAKSNTSLPNQSFPQVSHAFFERAINLFEAMQNPRKVRPGGSIADLRRDNEMYLTMLEGASNYSGSSGSQRYYIKK